MQNYPSNSRKSKEAIVAPKAEEKVEEKKVEKVTTGEVIRRKKPLGRKFTETFINGDAKSTWAYVAFDVLIPSAKDMFVDAIQQAAERMFYGEARSRKFSQRPTGSTGYINYNRASSSGPGKDDRRPSMSRKARASHNFDEIILDTRVEAEEVIDHLFSLVSKYEVATVADLYELIGTTSDYTDDKWGWYDLRGAGAVQVRSGYLLELPKPEPLEQ